METITGFVDHIVFQNSENGYTVMILSTEGEEMTCVGMCKGLTQGENISAEGEYIEHPVYGRQFKIQSYETVTPTDRVGMERYLGSGAIRGVGEALAARIVKKFGDDTFRIIEEEPERLAELETTLKRYESITPDKLRENYKYFLDAVIPVCEEVGVKMAVHPDDPAWPIFGLPRISHSQEDFDKIVALHDSPANALCLCTGSLGSNPDNDIPAIIRHFGEMDRIACLHIRNVKYLGHHKFREAAHLSSAGDLDLFEIVKAVYDTCPHDVYVRPDHGRMIWDEVGRPGYGLYDRALGAVYLNGLWEAIDKMTNK